MGNSELNVKLGVNVFETCIRSLGLALVLLKQIKRNLALALVLFLKIRMRPCARYGFVRVNETTPSLWFL